MRYWTESRESLTGVAKALDNAVQRHKFGVLMGHDLKQKMKEKGDVDFDRG